MEREYRVEKICKLIDKLGNAREEEDWHTLGVVAMRIWIILNHIECDNAYDPSAEDTFDQLIGKLEMNIESFSLPELKETVTIISDKALTLEEHYESGEYLKELDDEWKITEAREYEAQARAEGRDEVV